MLCNLNLVEASNAVQIENALKAESSDIPERNAENSISSGFTRCVVA